MAKQAVEKLDCEQAQRTVGAHHGWVWKRSAHIKKWNRRYFVLLPPGDTVDSARLLLYYTTDAGPVKPKGLIRLLPGGFGVSTEHMPQREWPIALCLTTNPPQAHDEVRQRVLFAAENEERTLAWAAAISQPETGTGLPAPSAAAAPLAAGEPGTTVRPARRSDAAILASFIAARASAEYEDVDTGSLVLLRKEQLAADGWPSEPAVPSFWAWVAENKVQKGHGDTQVVGWVMVVRI